jgi:hypothetical protein
MLRRLLSEPTFAESCRMESHFPQMLVESAMSSAVSIYCDLDFYNNYFFFFQI